MAALTIPVIHRKAGAMRRVAHRTGCQGLRDFPDFHNCSKYERLLKAPIIGDQDGILRVSKSFQVQTSAGFKDQCLMIIILLGG